MKTVFMGTPEFADSALRTLISSRHEVAAVFTRADAEKGRGHKILPPPVKITALENGIAVYQPKTLRDGEAEKILRAINPDAIIVAAYGRILPDEILSLPRFGCINLHGSLLPRLRGAAPIQRAVIDGERETGVTVMRMDSGIDTGDTLLRESFPIGDMYCAEVTERMCEISSRLLLTALDMIENGSAEWEKQDENGATYAKKIEKDDYRIDFSRTAEEVLRLIRALSPETQAVLCGGRVKIVRAVPSPDEKPEGILPGTVAAVSGKGDGWFDVACGDGMIRVLRLIPEGKGDQSAGDAVRGRKIFTEI